MLNWVNRQQEVGHIATNQRLGYFWLNLSKTLFSGRTESFVMQRPVGAYSRILLSLMWKMLLHTTRLELQIKV